jgi:hypothetical protein
MIQSMDEWCRDTAARFGLYGVRFTWELTGEQRTIFWIFAVRGRIPVRWPAALMSPDMTLRIAEEARRAAEAREQELLDALAHANSLEYERRRQAAAAQLGVRALYLDRVIRERRRENEVIRNAKIPLKPWWQVSAWPAKVDGAELFVETIAHLGDVVIIDPQNLKLAAGLVPLSWCHEALYRAPLGWIWGADAQFGKSTLAKRLSYIVRKGVTGEGFTRASIYRMADQHHPCLIVDEADKWAQKNGIAELLNAAHTRDGGVWVSDGRRGGRFFTAWIPVIITAIGRRRTISTAQRTIDIECKPPLEHEKPKFARWKLNDTPEAARLRSRWQRWSAENMAALGEILQGDIPSPVGLRNADSFEFLFAFGDLIGGTWGQEFRDLAVWNFGQDDDAEKLGEGSRVVIAMWQHGFIGNETAAASRDIITRICERYPEASWAEELSKGSPESRGRRLANLVGNFRLTREDVRVDGRTAKGYARDAGLRDWYDRLVNVRGPVAAASPPPSKK